MFSLDKQLLSVFIVQIDPQKGWPVSLKVAMSVTLKKEQQTFN